MIYAYYWLSTIEGIIKGPAIDVKTGKVALACVESTRTHNKPH